MVYLVMDHLLMVLVLLWSSGSQCESTAKADIVLLVCESISISPEEYKTFRSFLNQTVSNFNIGPDKVQIGLVQYGGILENEWQLNTHQTKQSLLEAIAKLRLTKRLCAIGRALNYILRNSFKSEVGMRADSQKIVILITDEESPEYIYPDSRDLRDPSIEVYTIGVKNAKEAQLRAVASDPEEIHMFSVSDYLFLLDITDNLTISLCNSVNNYKLGSEHVRLVGGASRCAGTLEVKKGGWRPVKYSDWTLKEAASVYSVRLVNGTSLCSGRLEVKSEQSWSSVCEADFDQQDAEVVCRELGCGAPSVLQGALYGEVEAPMWTKEFQCGGHESALLDCGRSDSARSTCSPGKAVGLTCSEPVRLVGGASRCAGTLEVKQGEWRPVAFSFSMVAPHWTLKEAAVICRDLDCGSAVSIAGRNEPPPIFVWKITSDCVQSGSTLRDCALLSYTSSIVELTCSGTSISDSNIFLPLSQ
ncbi:scavenger receptor cysteine-rich type 1 protein M130-like [Thunnus albacares]|uniref:scavenger receptor cysteine-rich type 1 protein M130-like n=1 Tax=Thunnus albacares TaxID=8236 RepID=UPI001CF611F9|nr:scavenger receptor cysteine-rich type 1 protein M130-like [Thunnus albacares]